VVHKTKKITLWKFNRVAVGDTGLKKIEKIMKERDKNKKSFWLPVVENAIKKAKRRGYITGMLGVEANRSRSFSQFRKVVEQKASGYSYFAPMSESFELYGRIVTKDLAKKLGVKVEEI
jgi:hypothetical protein